MGLLCKEHDFQAEVCRARMLQATEAQKSRSPGGREPVNSRACTSLGSVIPTYPGPLGSICEVSGLEADQRKFYSEK